MKKQGLSEEGVQVESAGLPAKGFLDTLRRDVRCAWIVTYGILTILEVPRRGARPVSKRAGTGMAAAAPPPGRDRRPRRTAARHQP